MLSGGKVVVFLQVSLQFLVKNIALLVKKNFGINFVCQNPFSAILRLKTERKKIHFSIFEGNHKTNYSISVAQLRCALEKKNTKFVDGSRCKQML